MFFLLKILTSAFVIGVVTEIAKRFPTTGGMIAALPIVSLLSIIWLSVQGESSTTLSQFARGVLFGFPSTIVLLVIVSLSLRFSYSVTTSILLGVAGWFLIISIQNFVMNPS